MSRTSCVLVARTWSVLVAGLLASLICLAGAVGAGPAWAHDALTGSTPADGATVTAAPEQVVLSFTAEVKDLGLTVLVTSPEGRRVGDGPARVEGRDVIAPLQQLTEPGRYTVAYRVVSSDGHPIQGRLAFVLDGPSPSPTPSATGSAPPTAAATATAPTSPAASPVASSTDGGGSPWPWLVGGIALVALVGGAIAVLRSRST